MCCRHGDGCKVISESAEVRNSNREDSHFSPKKAGESLKELGAENNW